MTTQMTNFGWRRDRENVALLAGNSDHIHAAVAGFTAPEEIDPRPWHRIENQKNMGSCEGHANSSVCEMAYHIATDDVTQFSPLFAYYAAQKIDGLLGSDNGATITGGMQAAKQFGSCPLEKMPYPDPVQYTGRFPDGAFEAAKPFLIRSHAVCRSYNDVFTFLASGQGGVEIGIAWGQGLQVNQQGCVEFYTPGPGGHALCFLGYSRRVDSQGRKYMRLANSWSEHWGDKGWAEVAPRAVDQMCQHPDTVMIGLSDLTTPKVRVIKWAGKKNPWREAP
jgi:hypothetical protein